MHVTTRICPPFAEVCEPEAPASFSGNDPRLRFGLPVRVGAKGLSDRHSCLSNSSLKQLKTGKNACRYLKCPNSRDPALKRGANENVSNQSGPSGSGEMPHCNCEIQYLPLFNFGNGIKPNRLVTLSACGTSRN